MFNQLLQEKEQDKAAIFESPKSALGLKREEKSVVSKYEEKKMAQAVNLEETLQNSIDTRTEVHSMSDGADGDYEIESEEENIPRISDKPRNLSRLDNIYKRKHSPIQQRLKDLKTTERNRRIDKKINDLRICNKPDAISPENLKGTPMNALQKSSSKICKDLGGSMDIISRAILNEKNKENRFKDPKECKLISRKNELLKI